MMKNNTLNNKKLAYKFYFQDGDNQIACFCSYFTGKEQVYVNDELVSAKRSMNVCSHHKFKLADERYEVTFEMQNILTGRLVCTLYKNKQRFKQYQHTSLTSSTKTSLKVIGWSFLGGAVLGFIFVATLHLIY